MMKKTKFKKDWVTRGIAVCGFAILGGLIIQIPAVATVLDQTQVSDPNSLNNLIVIKSNTVNRVESFEEGNTLKENTSPPLENLGIQYMIDGKEAPADEALSVPADNIQSITVKKDEEQPKVEITTKETKPQVEYTGSANYKKDPKEKGYLENYPDAFISTEKSAQYKGGEGQLMMDLTKSIVYPKEAMEKGIQGRVVVRFQINPNGTISNCEVPYSPNPLLNEAAVKAVEATSGNWIPGENGGKPVASVFNLPVTFKLSGQESE